MQKKVGVVISAVMMVVILATILSFSFAWFNARQPNVYAHYGKMTAGNPDPVDVTMSLSENNKFCGETGTDIVYSGEDFPFRAFDTVKVTVNPSTTNAIFASISGLRITLPDNTVLDSKNIPGLSNHFAWDIYYVQTTSGVVKDSYFPCWHFDGGAVEGDFFDANGNPVSNTTFTHYFPSCCFDANDNFIRDINGNKFTIPSIGKSKTYTFVVVITFLDQASACLHKKLAGLEHPNHDVCDSITPFAYSAYDYMNTSFAIDFSIGQATYSFTIGGGGLLS